MKIKIRKENGTKQETLKISRKSYVSFKNLYSTKLENIKEMDIFNIYYHISKWNEDQVSNINRPVTLSEIGVI